MNLCLLPVAPERYARRLVRVTSAKDKMAEPRAIAKNFLPLPSARWLTSHIARRTYA